ncbi:MAG: biotin transporter BioY [Oscillospiraceae bacterium]|nr:biotin transporter BioY [Oscillospiraceae bacterium]
METQTAVKRGGLRRLTRSALCAALLCICAPITIPIGPVPITLSLFAVMLIGILLRPWEAGVSVCVYLLLGLCGLPVFAGGNSGVPVLVGPTGGYLWSYVPMAVLVSCLSRIPCKGKTWATAMALLGCVVGTAVCYLCGTWQFAAVAGYTWREALSICVLPFAPFDLLKAVCASAVGVQVRAILRRSGTL